MPLAHLPRCMESYVMRFRIISDNVENNYMDEQRVTYTRSRKQKHSD